MWKLLPALLTMLLPSMGAAFASPYEDGKVAAARGSYATAARLYRQGAAEGDANSQVELGMIYQNGTGGVLQDYAEALKWYRLAAAQNNALAQLYIGTMYYEGKAVPQNRSEAVSWYRLSAQRGNMQAQTFLAAMYSDGDGVA